MANYKFGEIEGVKEGDVFRDRAELRDKGIHKVLQAGIDGNWKVGCQSIVLSGGYKDDLDLGDEIIYTGVGGNDPNTNKQIGDQSWETNGNKSLITSYLHGLPVRVTRGYKHNSKYSPKSGYQYAGLYLVTNHFEEIGIHGFKICRFRLEKIKKADITFNVDTILSSGNKNPTRAEVTYSRIIRDTRVSKEIKELYNYECQICGIIIEINGVRYAEAAHIKPLGKPHNGEDTTENLICLCPNHHVMFDIGAIGIDEDFNGIGFSGKLKINNTHSIVIKNIQYHREHILMV